MLLLLRSLSLLTALEAPMSFLLSAILFLLFGSPLMISLMVCESRGAYLMSLDGEGLEVLGGVVFSRS